MTNWNAHRSLRLGLVAAAGAVLAISVGAASAHARDGRIVFYGCDASTCQIYTVNPDGTALRQVTHDAAVKFNPDWSPDGRRIVYLETSSSGDTYQAEIRVVDATGANDQVLYRSGCCIDDWRSPVFSPDGRMIAFSLIIVDRSNEIVGSHVYLMGADGSDVRRIPGFGALAWQALPR